MFALLLFAGHPAAAGEGVEPGAQAAAPTVIIDYFRAEGCPHCAHAGEFLRRYAADARIAIRDYEVNNDALGRERYIKVMQTLRVRDPGVPFIVIGDWAVMGYQNDERTGAAIAARVARCLGQPCADSVSAILAGRPAPTPVRVEEAGALPEAITLPLIGEVATATLSLPALTVVLGAIDGFNPCAMWALVFLLGLLMGTKDRKRMWILGLTFLFGSALVYFLIMAAWLNVLLVIGFSYWIRIAVGVVALAAAAYYLYDFVANPDAACEVSHGGKRQQVLGRLRRFALEQRLWPAVFGVLLLAIAVNMIELVCSAGIPAVYTQVLALTLTPVWQYYGYLLLYNLVYMLDDIAIFYVAVATLQMTGIGTRYARASRLIGGIVLAAIGLMLLFRPQWLVFY
jgi:glutaredoxin